MGIPDALIADPRVGITQDGMTLELAPILSGKEEGSDRSLELDLTLTLAKLRNPLPEVRVPGRIPGEAGFLVQLPVFANERLKTKVRLPADKVLFFGGLGSYQRDRLLMTFIRWRSARAVASPGATN